MGYDEERKLVNDWFCQQWKQTNGNNWKRSKEVSDRLEKLGVDGFGKELGVKPDEALSLFMEARRQDYALACTLHEREVLNV